MSNVKTTRFGRPLLRNGHHTHAPCYLSLVLSGSLGSTMVHVICVISWWMDPGFKTPNFSAISIAFAKERRSPFSALLRQTSAAATILGTLRTPCASFIRMILKKASLSSPVLFFLPLGRPFGFPDWPFLKRVCMSYRSSSVILLLLAAVRDNLSR